MAATRGVFLALVLVGLSVPGAPAAGKRSPGSSGSAPRSAVPPGSQPPRQRWKLAMEPRPKNGLPPVLGSLTAEHAVVSGWVDDATRRLSVVGLDTGARLWQRTFRNLAHYLAEGDVLYLVRGRDTATQPVNELVALDLASGRELWSAPADASSAERWLLAAEGRVLWRGLIGSAVCAEARTGKVLWRLNDAGTPVGLGRGLALLQTGPPDAAAAYGVYVNVVEAATGRRLRQFRFRTTEAAGYNLDRTFLSAVPELILGQESWVGVGFEAYNLRAFGNDGTRKWDAAEPLVGPVRVGDHLIALRWRDGNLYGVEGVAALNLKTGKLVWNQKNPKGRESQIVGAWGEGVVVFETASGLRLPGRLLAREAMTGKLRWSRVLRADQVQASGPWLVTLREAAANTELVGYRR